MEEVVIACDWTPLIKAFAALVWVAVIAGVVCIESLIEP